MHRVFHCKAVIVLYFLTGLKLSRIRRRRGRGTEDANAWIEGLTAGDIQGRESNITLQ